MEKPHTGLDDSLRMLLSCFRKKDVCSHLPCLSHFHSILLCIAYPPLLASCGRSDESPLGQCKMEAKRGFVRGGEEEEEMGEEGRRGGEDSQSLTRTKCGVKVYNTAIQKGTLLVKAKLAHYYQQRSLLSWVSAQQMTCNSLK